MDRCTTQTQRNTNVANAVRSQARHFKGRAGFREGGVCRVGIRNKMDLGHPIPSQRFTKKHLMTCRDFNHMTNNDKVRKLIEKLHRGGCKLADQRKAARLIEKLTGKPSEAMSEAGVEASRYYVTGFAATNMSYKAMIQQGIKEVLDKQEQEQ